MASIRKRGSSWVVDVCIGRERQSKSFKSKADATAWAADKEKNGILPSKTFFDAIQRYIPIAEGQLGYGPKMSRLSMLERHPISQIRLENLTRADITDYRESRIGLVSSTSVRIEMNLIGTILRLCEEEWGWISSNPAKTVRKPSPRPPRRRGITQSEIDQILLNLKSARHGDLISGMFVLALETGMRLGELLKLEWSDVFEKYVLLRKTKNGDSRTVPLSPIARDILRFRPRPKPFPLTQHVASQMFRRYSINGVHFHDSRSEAITRLSKKLDVLQLAKMIGHRDLKSLMFYYAESPESIADRL